MQERATVTKLATDFSKVGGQFFEDMDALKMAIAIFNYEKKDWRVPQELEG